MKLSSGFPRTVSDAPPFSRSPEGADRAFRAAKAAERGSHDLAEIARAAAAGRHSTLLIEADRVVSGHFDPVSGAIQFAERRDPMVDDVDCSG
jgi:hypothetical protein